MDISLHFCLLSTYYSASPLSFSFSWSGMIEKSSRNLIRNQFVNNTIVTGKSRRSWKRNRIKEECQRTRTIKKIEKSHKTSQMRLFFRSGLDIFSVWLNFIFFSATLLYIECRKRMTSSSAVNLIIINHLHLKRNNYEKAASRLTLKKADEFGPSKSKTARLIVTSIPKRSPSRTMAPLIA